MTLTHTPFADLITKAKDREADEAAKRSALKELADQAAADRAAAQRAAAQAKAEQEAADAARRALDGFARNYLVAATKIVRPTWSSAYIEAVARHSAALLEEHDVTVDLPSIDPRHVTALLDKFEYGLELAERHRRPIPDGTFLGQRLLAEREAAKPVQPPALVIKPGAVPSGRAEAASPVVKTDADPKPATTARKKRDRRPGRKQATV